MLNNTKAKIIKIFAIMLCFVPLVYAADSVPEDKITWVAILPPLVAISLALITKEVISSLLAGIFAGSFFLASGNPFKALVNIPTDFIWGSVADSGHAAIILFSMMLGGMVGILSASGGTAGIVQAMRKVVSHRRGGLIMTWVLGIIIFFDDYANTLLVGHTMRPYTDKLKISRAKLAYIVDSTAAPVASLAVISTWIGFEVGLLQDFTNTVPGVYDGYALFLRSLPYRFYSILALLFVLSLSIWNRDFGPMRKAEIEAMNGNDNTISEKIESDDKKPEEIVRGAIWIALVPILSVIVLTFFGLYFSGKESTSVNSKLFEIIGNADSSKVLLQSSFLGIIISALMAILLGRMNIRKVSNALIDGYKSMVPAMVILTLAWSLGEVCSRIGTAEYVVNAVAGNLPHFLVPTIVFLVAAAVAFSTGTSWGTMAILIPIALPIAHQIPLALGISSSVANSILLGSAGAVLAGSTFGDHCSPISDTTILSSMASGCDHIAHVKTQIPYAVLTGIIALTLGYIPVGFGVPVWVCLPLAIAVIFILPILFKKSK